MRGSPMPISPIYPFGTPLSKVRTYDSGPPGDDEPGNHLHIHLTDPREALGDPPPAARPANLLRSPRSPKSPSSDEYPDEEEEPQIPPAGNRAIAKLLPPPA